MVVVLDVIVFLCMFVFVIILVFVFVSVTRSPIELSDSRLDESEVSLL